MRGEELPLQRQFDVIIERDEEGYYIASVPQLHGCHTQARSVDEVTVRIREAIELWLEEQGAPGDSLEFIGIERITVASTAGGRGPPALTLCRRWAGWRVRCGE